MKTRSFIALLALALAGSAPAQSTIDPTQPYAWGANIGWTHWRPSAADGVIIGEYVCSGWIYGANVGWIHLGDGTPANGIRYQNNSAADFGVNVMSDGTVRGYAWGANIGWINFEATGAPRVNLFTGRLTGYAYGANISWINLDDTGANYVRTSTIPTGADLDGDGIPDAWELEHPGAPPLSGTGDADGDGTSDLAEYLADTDPRNGGDALRITHFTSTSGLLTSLTWTSRPTRLYFLEKSNSLTAGTWLDSGLNGIPGAFGTTTRAFADTFAPVRFFRVKAQRPLTP